MAKENAFAGTGAFNKKAPEPQPDVEPTGKFMIGAHFPMRLQWEFREILTAARTNVKGALAEALDDFAEKHGKSRMFKDAVIEEKQRVALKRGDKP